MRRRNVSPYEQFEISPDAIEQELRRAVCEHRHTGRHIHLRITSRVHIEGKSSVCVICMKYRITILIIIIINLGQKTLSYI